MPMRLSTRLGAYFAAGIGVLLLLFAILVSLSTANRHESQRIQQHIVPIIEVTNRMLTELERLENEEFLYFLRSEDTRTHQKAFDLAADAFELEHVRAQEFADAPAERQALADLERHYRQFVMIDAQLREMIASGRIAVRVSGGPDGLSTTVSDTGVGISNQALARVFSPFFQADLTSTREFGGMGLGLAIAYQIVTRMGGSMRVQSRLGRGSRFDFTLPLATGDGPPGRVPAGIEATG